MDRYEVDVAVIGAGTAGMAAWRAAHAAGRRAVLIEYGPPGTTCARVGCMPSKVLLAAAHGLYDASQLGARGVHGTGGLHAVPAEVMRVVRRERDHFVRGVLDELADFPKGVFIAGQASFAPRPADVRDRQWLKIRDTEGNIRELDARAVVIATGARPAVPDAFRVFGSHLLTSDDVFELRTLPERIAVFGAGPVALELGQGLARLGSQVSIFGRGNQVGGVDDPAVRDALARCLADELPFDPDAKVDGMSLRAGKPSINFRDSEGQSRREGFDAVLVATGRAPALDALDLQHAGIKVDQRGVPVFNESTMQCGSSNVFIAGDCDGTRPWLYDATDEGRLAGENAARYPDVESVERKVPLSIVFCDPQVALVGERWESLQAGAHGDVVTGTLSFADQGRSRINGKARGMLNIYASVHDGRILGGQMCGPDAEHLGHMLAWLTQLGLSLDAALQLPFYHPVVEEGLRTALENAQARRCTVRNETVPQRIGCVGP